MTDRAPHDLSAVDASDGSSLVDLRRAAAEMRAESLPSTISDANVPPRLTQAFNDWVMFSGNRAKVAGTQWEPEWNEKREKLFHALGCVAVDDFFELDTSVLKPEQRATIERALVQTIDREGWQTVDVAGWVADVFDKGVKKGLLQQFLDWHFPDPEDLEPYHRWITDFVDVDAPDTTGNKGLPLAWGVPQGLLRPGPLMLEHRAEFVKLMRHVQGDALLNVRGIGRLVGEALDDATGEHLRDRKLKDDAQSVAAELLIASLEYRGADYDKAIVKANLNDLLVGLSSTPSHVQGHVWDKALGHARGDWTSLLLDVMVSRSSGVDAQAAEFQAFQILVAAESIRDVGAALILGVGIGQWSDIARAMIVGELEMPYDQAAKTYESASTVESLVLKLRYVLPLLDDEDIDDRPEVGPDDVLSVSRLLGACHQQLQSDWSSNPPSQRCLEALSALQGFVNSHSARVREFLGFDDEPTPRHLKENSDE